MNHTAAAADDRAHTAREAADLLFHALVLLRSAGVATSAVWDELDRRFGTGGLEEKVAFLIEIQFAGLFTIAGFKDNELKYLIGSQCMSILFPYAREVVSDLTTRGGFPPLLLSPVNFDALYQQHLQRTAESTDSAEESTAH